MQDLVTVQCRHYAPYTMRQRYKYSSGHRLGVDQAFHHLKEGRITDSNAGQTSIKGNKDSLVDGIHILHDTARSSPVPIQKQSMIFIPALILTEYR